MISWFIELVDSPCKARLDNSPHSVSVSGWGWEFGVRVGGGPCRVLPADSSPWAGRREAEKPVLTLVLAPHQPRPRHAQHRRSLPEPRSCDVLLLVPYGPPRPPRKPVCCVHPRASSASVSRDFGGRDGLLDFPQGCPAAPTPVTQGRTPRPSVYTWSRLGLCRSRV